MKESNTTLVEKGKSKDTFLFAFARQCYEGYKVMYNFITGKMTMLNPDGTMFFDVTLRKFMDEVEFVKVVVEDKMLQLLLDIFLVDATPEAAETLEFVATESRLTKTQINPN